MSAQGDCGRLAAQSGQMVVIGAMLLVVLMGLAALSVDLGSAYLQDQHMQDYAASSASAGSRILRAAALSHATATDAQVQQAISNTLVASNAGKWCWEVSATASRCNLAALGAGWSAIRAEYVWVPATTQSGGPRLSGVIVGSLPSGAAVPTMTVTYAPSVGATPITTVTVPNGVQIDSALTNSAALFARVLGRSTIQVSAAVAQDKVSRAPPARTNGLDSPTAIATLTPTPAPSNTATTAPTATPRPTACGGVITFPGSSLGGGQSYYKVITVGATGDVTATLLEIIPGSANNNMDVYLYSGSPSALPTSGTFNPTTDGLPAGTSATLDSQSVSVKSPPLVLDYSADKGGQLAAGTYTLLYYNESSQPLSVLGYYTVPCVPPTATPTPTVAPTSTATGVPTPTAVTVHYPAGIFVPFNIWGGSPGGVAAGQSVNFWGAQWESNNNVSGNYFGNPRHKGYIDTPPAIFPPAGTVSNDSSLATEASQLASCQPPATTATSSGCWSTGPGNSSHASMPPDFQSGVYATRPLFIDVVVSTYIGMSGGKDYGNIAAIVKIQVTDPNSYKNDPGHAGLGTIVCTVWNSSTVAPISSAPTC